MSLTLLEELVRQTESDAQKFKAEPLYNGGSPDGKAKIVCVGGLGGKVAYPVKPDRARLKDRYLEAIKAETTIKA